jgi:hypothetical protein
MLARAWLLLPPLTALGRPTDRRWLGLPVDRRVSFERDSWTAPVDARRLHPLDDTDQQAAGQVRALLERLPAGGVVPWFVFDGGYDSAQLSLDLAEERVAVLVRLRSDRCFYADPPPPPPGKIGRPRRHGAKLNCADPASWPTPTATLHTSDDQYGSVTVAAWSGLHPKQQRHPGHGTRGPRPIVRGTVIRVQVERVPARTRPPKVLWLWQPGHLLAAAARLATRRGVAAAPPPAARPARPPGPARLVAGQPGQLERARQAQGCLTGPNPTDRGKLGSKYHLLVDRRGIPWPWACQRPTPTTRRC